MNESKLITKQNNSDGWSNKIGWTAKNTSIERNNSKNKQLLSSVGNLFGLHMRDVSISWLWTIIVLITALQLPEQ